MFGLNSPIVVDSDLPWWFRLLWAADNKLHPADPTEYRAEALNHPIYPTPPLGQDMTQGQFLSGVLTGLNSEFSFSYTSCLTKAEEPSLPYYLPIAGGRIIGFIPFPRVLVICEMQSVLYRIWTRVAVFISYDDNHYTRSFESWVFCFAADVGAWLGFHDNLLRLGLTQGIYFSSLVMIRCKKPFLFCRWSSSLCMKTCVCVRRLSASIRTALNVLAFESFLILSNFF